MYTFRVRLSVQGPSAEALWRLPTLSPRARLFFLSLSLSRSTLLPSLPCSPLSPRIASADFRSPILGEAAAPGAQVVVAAIRVTGMTGTIAFRVQVAPSQGNGRIS